MIAIFARLRLSSSGHYALRTNLEEKVAIGEQLTVKSSFTVHMQANCGYMIITCAE